MLGESWSEKRKAEIETAMTARGFKLLEHTVIGDFDLALWIGTGNDELKGIKALSINNGEIDPGSTEGQSEQTTPQFLNWSKVLSLLQIWVDRYGKLLVGSASLSNLRGIGGHWARNFQFLITMKISPCADFSSTRTHDYA